MFAGCPRCARGVAVNLTVDYDLGPLAGLGPGLCPRPRAAPGDIAPCSPSARSGR